MKNLKIDPPIPKLVEICRSFSYKLNTGNYESRDFFCSQKAECLESEAEKVSEALHQFVKKEVIKSVNAYKLEFKPPEKKLGFKEQQEKNQADQNKADDIPPLPILEQ